MHKQSFTHYWFNTKKRKNNGGHEGPDFGQHSLLCLLQVKPGALECTNKVSHTKGLPKKEKNNGGYKSQTLDTTLYYASSM